MKLHKGWTTHMPLVIKLVQATTGPVMELGAGLFSTPLLHWLCAEARRPLVSYEDEKEYYKFSQTFQSRNHRIRFIENWDDVKPDGHFSVILIDHKTDRRSIDAVRFKNNADYIILHDSESESYHYDEVYPHFKYIYHWKFSKPWTTVVSNFKNLTDLDEEVKMIEKKEVPIIKETFSEEITREPKGKKLLKKIKKPIIKKSSLISKKNKLIRNNKKL